MLNTPEVHFQSTFHKSRVNYVSGKFMSCPAFLTSYKKIVRNVGIPPHQYTTS